MRGPRGPIVPREGHAPAREVLEIESSREAFSVTLPLKKADEKEAEVASAGPQPLELPAQKEA